MIKSTTKKNIEVILTISEWSESGHGLGYHELQPGKPSLFEVPFTLPGDKVRVKLIRKRRGVFACLLEEIITPSPLRIAPLCTHFGSCGGCRSQNLSYERQLKLKEEMIRRSLKTSLHPSVELNPIIGCDPPWHYRNKMELTFSSKLSGERFLGLIMYGGRGRAFNMQECYLCPSWMVKVKEGVKKWWENSSLESYHAPKDKGSLRTLTLRGSERTGDRMAMLTVSGKPEYALNKQHIDSLVSSLQPLLESQGKISIFLRIQQIAKGRATQFYEMLLKGSDVFQEILFLDVDSTQPPLELKFNVSPMAFFQPNTRQAEKLYSRAIQMARIKKDDTVFDLYCGTGTLGIAVAKYSKQVVGIELCPEAVLDAKENIKINNLNNMRILGGDVGKMLAELSQESSFVIPDVVMVDPPRAGLDECAINCLITLKSPKIVYVSCNPVSQGKNIILLEKAGYKLIAIQPVDQFPHTLHVENIAVLERVVS